MKGSRLPFVGHRFGRLVLTTCRQPAGAPIIDDAFTNDQEGNRYRSKAILLRPWKKNRHGERGGRALVIGWREPRRG